MNFEKVLNENIVQLDESSIQGLMAIISKNNKFTTRGISPGVILNSENRKPVKVSEVARLAQEAGITDYDVVEKIKNLIIKRNGQKIDKSDKAITDFKQAYSKSPYGRK